MLSIRSEEEDEEDFRCTVATEKVTPAKQDTNQQCTLSSFVV